MAGQQFAAPTSRRWSTSCSICATAQHRGQELTATRKRLETSTRTAGNPAEYEEVLAVLAASRRDP